MRECHNNNKQKDCLSCHTFFVYSPVSTCCLFYVCSISLYLCLCLISMLEMQLLMIIKQANKHVCSFGFSHIGLLDDGEIYDEFGNLKKKFHAKTQQAESGQMVPGSGRAGWEVDEIVMTGRHGMDKSRDRYRDSNKRESSKNREIDGPERERRRSRSREKESECEKERGRVSDAEHLVQKMLVIGSSA
ncbi:unnamed protein product [Musa acuminata var. zebrina]